MCGEARRASAQDAPPDLKMLMNLDLFEPRPNSARYAAAPADAPSDDSMFDQIRTLDQMGYLGNQGEADGNDAPTPGAAVGVQPGAEDVAPARTPAPMPASQPGYDAEGPQP